MKKIVLLFLIGIITNIASAQEDEKISPSTIDAVTVYLNGAQINRNASLTVPAGRSYVVFNKLSEYVDVNSIQVNGTGNITILSVIKRMNYLDDPVVKKKVVDLKEELESLQFKYDQRTKMASVYTSEREMILNNQVITSQQEGLDLVDLMDYAAYYEKQILEIAYKMIDISNEQQKLMVEITDVNNQLNSLNARGNNHYSEVVVQVSSDKAVKTKIKLSYFVSGAGWTPIYDVRATDVNSPINLTYKANVYQNTGSDWNDVLITLSTGNPNLSGTPPELYSWILSIQEANYGKYDNRNMSNAVLPVENGKNDPSFGIEGDDTYTWDYTSITNTNINTEFKINIPYTIPSDGKIHNVEIAKNDLPVVYKYYSAPKIDKDAFLLAGVSGWEQYNLLPGFANIYFKGTYVGKSYLNTTITSDTLQISLGRDKDVVVDRKKVKDLSKQGSSNKVVVEMETTIRNTKNTTIELVLEDQIPISGTKDIKVEVVNSDGATLIENSGKLIWKIMLNPEETKMVKFSYTVKYPKDKELLNL